MLTKKFLGSTLAVFIATMAFDWYFHGLLMMPQYEMLAEKWRPMEKMEDFMVLCWLLHAIVAGALAYIFMQHFENRGWAEAVRFGVPVGLLIGALEAGWYIILPVPSVLGIAWFIGGLLKGIIAGLVLVACHRCCNRTTKA